MRLPALALAFLSLALPAQSIGEYFVNGMTGQDLPSHGRSPLTPWKTIAYATRNIPPITNPATWNTLFVEGDQVYSAATNGDALPIRPSYNLWIEGTFAGHGRWPILRPNAGGVAMLFDPAVPFERNPSTMRYLVFEGGAYGIIMGNSTQRHRPRIQDCVFRGQTSACVRIEHAFNSRGNDPRFFQTTFSNAPRGIDVLASTAGAVVYPDVEECTFAGLGTAIQLDDRSSGGNVGGTFRSNWFRNCTRGVHVRSGPSATTTNFRVYSCSFTEILEEAVYLQLDRPPDPAAVVEQSSFLQCGTAVALVGWLTPGPYSLVLGKNVAHRCTYGLRVDLNGSGSCAIESQDNLFELSSYGVSLLNRSVGVQLLYRSLGDRLLRNGIGASLSDPGAFSTLLVQSAMVCGNTITGLNLASTTRLVAHSLTLADNATALQAPGSAAALDHCVFAGNVTDVVGSPAITYSCFGSTTYAGVGNLNRTDPQLVRPLYKLAPSSPCIDRGNVATPLPATDYEGDPRASVSRMNGSPLPDLGADEYVQLGSARKYGVRGFGYYNFFPEISSPSSRVVIGGTLLVELTGAILPVFGVAARDAYLIMGLRDDPGAMPFDLAIIGSPGSLLWSDLVALVGLFPVTPAGTVSLPIYIPAVTDLVGQTVTFQWLANQRSANPHGPVASDGLRVTIGQ